MLSYSIPAKDLSIAQCAFLAGINHSPNSYNPYSGNDVTEKIAKRTKTVLSQMKKFNYITQEEYDNAVAEVDAGFKFENGAKGNVYSSHTDAISLNSSGHLKKIVPPLVQSIPSSSHVSTTDFIAAKFLTNTVPPRL